MPPITRTVPLLPVPADRITLPFKRIPLLISNLPDLRDLFIHLFGPVFGSASWNAKIRTTKIEVGCVAIMPPEALKVTAGKNGNVAGEQQTSTVDLPADHPARKGLYEYGALTTVVGVYTVGSGKPVLKLEGTRRFKIIRIKAEKPFFEAEVEVHQGDDIPIDDEIRTLFDQLQTAYREFIIFFQLSSTLGLNTPINPGQHAAMHNFYRQLKSAKVGNQVPVMCLWADGIMMLFPGSIKVQLKVLATWDVKERLQIVVQHFKQLTESVRANLEIKNSDYSIIANGIKNAPANAIPTLFMEPQTSKMLGSQTLSSRAPTTTQSGGSNSEIEELKCRLEAATPSLEARKVIVKEMARLSRMNPIQAEYSVLWNYLEIMAEIPWCKVTPDQLGRDSLAKARKQLDDDHYGLEKIKKRLVEHIAVLRLKKDVSNQLAAREAQDRVNAKNTSANSAEVQANVAHHPPTTQKSLETKRAISSADRSPILLLVGPPGTGKTALSKSIATTLGREFHRVSLGGVRDEAAIRGHRRTYVAAMPGLIVNGLRKVGVSNPVILLDEIDKLSSSSMQGDPSAAMLEVLDPEQNHTFKDHFIGVPIDLSQVLFVATANTVDTIPAPLLDRMETITLSGYTTLEKRQIARRHLIPKQVVANGLREDQVYFDDSIIDNIITFYTREAGVRNLEREIGAVCRSKAVEYASAMDDGQPDKYRPEVMPFNIQDALGVEVFQEEIAEQSSRPGVVTGLVAYRSGGSGGILFIEVADMPGKGNVQLTGKLGDVLKESVEVALSWVKAHAFLLGLTKEPTEDLMEHRNLHVHCPAGAVPKDGPSAGIAHAVALLSLFTGRTVPPTLAMTGELALRGRITGVGGIKEKLIGALRAGVRTTLIPAPNLKDTQDLPDEIKSGLQIILINSIWEALNFIWPNTGWPTEEPSDDPEGHI